MERNRIFAGPWVGEFAWEVFAWQGYLRNIAHNYSHVTVCSRPDRRFLYEDFIDDFVPFSPSSEAASMWACHGMKNNEFNDLMPAPNIKWADPRVILPKLLQKRKSLPGLTTLDKFTPPDQKFIKYGKKDTTLAFDLVVHAANRTDAKAEKWWAPKNWPIENWNTFAEAFPDLSIACVGSPGQSHAVSGTTDLRGIPLREVADVLASCTLCAGCSDGLLNFAALCGTSRLIWSPAGKEGEKNIDRHTRCWNPFNAPVEMLMHKTWQIPAEIVINKTKEIFDSAKK